jgi:Ca2+-transporting ATPase
MISPPFRRPRATRAERDLPRLRVLPGRIRAEVTGLRGDATLARRIERFLRGQRGVRSAGANPVTGSVLILYDRCATGPDTLLDALRRLESFQRARAGPPPEHLEPLVSPSPRSRGVLLARALLPAVSTAVAMGVGIKVAVAGHHPRARSERLNALSVFLSALTGYPQLDRFLRVLVGPTAPLGPIRSYSVVATKGFREALLGLTADASAHLLGVLEQSAHWRARRTIGHALHRSGYARLRLGGGRDVAIPISELQPGELIHLGAEDVVPADGVIEEGTGLFDERVIGGSALLARKGPGDHVDVGARLEGGSLLVRLTATGPHTRLGRLLRRVPAAHDRALPPVVARSVSRMSTAGLVLACATLMLTWSWRRALAVLAVFNPSALALSALAVSGAATEAADGAGIRVLRRGAFDALARADVVLFSTAALTAPSPAVDAVVPLGGVRAETVLGLAASALRASAHPLGVALLEKARELGLDVPETGGVEEVAGGGVRGRDGGAELLVGEARFMADRGVALDASSGAQAALRARGSAALFVARQGRLLGVVGLRGRLLPGAREAVRGLRAAGITELGVLSAGPAEPAPRLAAELDIGRAWDGLGAAGTRALVRRLQRRGHVVAVVGARAGDMLAMAHADVAIGLAGPGWTPLAHVSHVILPEDRLGLLPGLVSLSRTVACVHRRHVAVAGAVSTAGGAAAAAGLLRLGMADEINHMLVLTLLANARRLSILLVEPAPHPGPRAPARGPAWHALTPRDVARLLGTDEDAGLPTDEADLRLGRRGPNMLAEAPPPGVGALVGQQLTTGMTLVLGAAAAALALIGESLNAVLVAGVVVANAGLGAAQEYRAGRAMAALRRYVTPMARCLRSGRVQLIPATQLVPGDVVLLQAGDTVPADGRILESYACEVEEAILTGEAMPVEKTADPAPPGAGLADRTSMVYMGTAVAAGRAKAIVVATGMDTAVGQIAGLLERPGRTHTPLGTRLAAVSRALAGIACLGGLLFVGAGLIRRLPLGSLVMGAVSLITAAVPEGMPAIVTVALSAAVQRMSRRALIVRRLSAVEMLGRVTVICCDKTGTLTQNRMAASAVVPSELGAAAEPAPDELRRDGTRWLLTAGTVCSDASLVDPVRRATVGSSTEGALLLAAADAGLDVAALRREYERVAELPFATERAFMAVVCRDPRGGLVLFLKGAPETIVGLCSHRGFPGHAAPLDAAGRDRVLRLSDRMADEALRVLAMAYLPLDVVPEAGRLERPQGCTLAGLIGMTDPLRPEVRDAVALCQRAGIRVVMATGDHRSTAVAIARQLGLPFSRADVLEGRDIDALSDADLGARLPRVRVFARVTPEHKLRIIAAMQARGEIVAMTGDGVNDAPAVKRADVGIAMGRSSTEVTRQASSIVVGDESFTSIVRAIEEGRGVRRNLRRAIGFLLGGNLGEALFVLGSILIAGRMPLLPLHLLLVNLFTDALPVMALAGLPAPAGALDRPPAGELFDPGFYRDVVRRGLVTGMAATAIYGLGGTGGLADPAAGRSLALAGLVASQLVQAQNWRSREQGDALFTASLGASWTALGGILTLPPMQRLFGTRSLGVLAWMRILAISAAADWMLRRLLLAEPRTATASSAGTVRTGTGRDVHE